jgi:hypothetical protein
VHGEIDQLAQLAREVLDVDPGPAVDLRWKFAREE